EPAVERAAVQAHAFVPPPHAAHRVGDEGLVALVLAVAQVGLAERDVEAPDLRVQPAPPAEPLEVHVELADVVLEPPEPHEVPLEGEPEVAQQRALADEEIAPEVGVEEQARVPDVEAKVLERA